MLQPEHSSKSVATTALLAGVATTALPRRGVFVGSWCCNQSTPSRGVVLGSSTSVATKGLLAGVATRTLFPRRNRRGILHGCFNDHSPARPTAYSSTNIDGVAVVYILPFLLSYGSKTSSSSSSSSSINNNISRGSSSIQGVSSSSSIQGGRNRRSNNDGGISAKTRA